MGPVGTALSDLAANIFAALLLILLILLGTGHPPSPSGSVDARADLHGLSRRPMAPEDIVRFLHERCPDAPGLSLDVTGDAPPVFDAGAAAGPVRLYVFSHAYHGSTTERLRQAGLTWRELSIPRALTGPQGGWSPGFLALVAQRPTLAEFRAGLARLLAAGSNAPRSEGGGAAGAGLLDRFRRVAGRGIAMTALIVGFGGVLLIEFLVPPARPRYDRGRTPPSTPISRATDDA